MSSNRETFEKEAAIQIKLNTTTGERVVGVLDKHEERIRSLEERFAELKGRLWIVFGSITALLAAAAAALFAKF